MDKLKKYISSILLVLVSATFAVTLALILCFTLPDRPTVPVFITMAMVFYLCFLWVFEDRDV